MKEAPPWQEQDSDHNTTEIPQCFMTKFFLKDFWEKNAATR